MYTVSNSVSNIQVNAENRFSCMWETVHEKAVQLKIVNFPQHGLHCRVPDMFKLGKTLSPLKWSWGCIHGRLSVPGACGSAVTAITAVATIGHIHRAHMLLAFASSFLNHDLTKYMYQLRTLKCEHLLFIF